MSVFASPPAGPSVRLGNGQLGLLTFLLVVLFAVPSRYVFAPLGGAGSPTQIIGMALLVVWMLRRAAGLGKRLTSVHWAMVLFAGAIVASYVFATLRSIQASEITAADRGLLNVVAWMGLFLTVADGLNTRTDLDTILRRLALGGGILAAFGLLQFITKQQLTNYIVIPGLSDNNGFLDLSERNGFTRPAGTAIHPIEFGAVLTMILPIALHYAMTDDHRSLARRWWPVAAIAIAVPISISRSAIISAVVILVALLPTWPKRVRRRAYGLIVMLSGFIYLVVPGLLGTLTGLFTGLSSDESAKSRTDSYALAEEFIHRSPVFGRGFRTLLTNYRILDNQYLGLAIEVGIVGLAATIALFAVAMAACWRIRRNSSDPTTRGLAQALFASVASFMFSAAVFDAFSFPMATVTLFLILGSVGALITASSSKRASSTLAPVSTMSEE